LSIEQAGGEAKTISPKAIPILRYFSGSNFPECKKARGLPIPQHSSTRSGWICLVVPKESVHVFRGIASTYSQAKRPG